MSIDQPLGELEAKLLRAMWSVDSECGRQKSVVTLRYAILPMNKWDAEVERALCTDGTEHGMVAEYYRTLCNLVTQTPYADGRGNFEVPAGPRYTDCRITNEGKRILSRGRNNEQ
jgi:hypothetical protein